MAYLGRHALVRQTLDSVLMLSDVHQRNAGHFAHATTKFSVAGGNDVTLVRVDTVDDAVICIRPLVTARQPFEAGITGDTERDTILGTQFLQFCQDARCDARDGCS